jgi:hypothetical protein
MNKLSRASEPRPEVPARFSLSTHVSVRSGRVAVLHLGGLSPMRSPENRQRAAERTGSPATWRRFSPGRLGPQSMDEPYAPGERAHRLCVLIAGNGPIRRLSNCCSKADRAENGESSESERRRRAPLRAGEVRSEDDRTSHIYFQVAVGDPGDSLSGSVRACATTSSWRTASSEAAAERSSRWSAR